MISAAASTPFHHHSPLVSIRQFKRNFPTRTTKAVMILKIFFHLSFLQKNLLLVTHLTVCRCEPCHLVMIVFVLPPYITFGKVSANITGKHDIAVSYYDKQVIRQLFPQQCQSFEDVFFNSVIKVKQSRWWWCETLGGRRLGVSPWDLLSVHIRAHNIIHKHTIRYLKTSQELRLLSRSLSDCKSRTPNVIIQVLVGGGGKLPSTTVSHCGGFQTFSPVFFTYLYHISHLINNMQNWSIPGGVRCTF